MKTLLFSDDLNLLDRWRNSLSSFEVLQIDSIETLYQEVLKEKSAVIVNLSACGKEPELFLKPIIDAEASVMILDPNPKYENTKKMVELGIRGYGNLMMHDVHLNDALKTILDGNVWLYPDFIDEMVLRLRSSVSTKTDNSDLLNQLSEREKEVALYIKDGLANKEIAKNLDITTRTVKAHTQHIYEKLGVSNRLALALLFNK